MITIFCLTVLLSGIQQNNHYNFPFDRVVAAFKATNPVITDHPDLGNKETIKGLTTYTREIDMDYKHKTYGVLTFRCQRIVTTSPDKFEVLLKGGNDEVKLTYRIVITSKQNSRRTSVYYRLDVTSAQESKLAVSVASRVLLRKRKNSLEKKLFPDRQKQLE